MLFMRLFNAGAAAKHAVLALWLKAEHV